MSRVRYVVMRCHVCRWTWQSLIAGPDTELEPCQECESTNVSIERDYQPDAPLGQQVGDEDQEALEEVAAASAACRGLDVEPAVLTRLADHGYLEGDHFLLTRKGLDALAQAAADGVSASAPSVPAAQVDTGS